MNPLIRDRLRFRHNGLAALDRLNDEQLDRLSKQLRSRTAIWNLLWVGVWMIWIGVWVVLAVSGSSVLASDVLFFALFVEGFGSLFVLDRFYIRWVERPLLLRLLGCCTNCSYDLTGNASGVCPECGRVVAALDGDGVK
jgi:hypothetical protein